MQPIETSTERANVTNVALASLQFANAQQEQFTELLEEVVQRQEELEPKKEDVSKREDTMSHDIEQDSPSVLVAGDTEVDAAEDGRGVALNIKV